MRIKGRKKERHGRGIKRSIWEGENGARARYVMIKRKEKEKRRSAHITRWKHET